MWNKDNNQQDIMKAKLKTLTSVLSLYGLSLSNNILQIGFSLILIRLLEPHHFGLFAALQYVVPEFFKDYIPFNKMRPFHVTTVISWIILCATGSIYFF